MRLLLPLRSCAQVLSLLLLTLAIPNAVSTQPLTPGVSESAPEVRERLSQAAGNTLLPPWQRDFMLGLARRGKSSALDSEPAGLRAGLPERAPAAIDGSWEELIVGVRAGHSAIYDPVRDRMVVFGGSSINDVWTLSLAGTPAWTELRPTGTPPSARAWQSAIYDPLRDRMVVFGGSNHTDVWALSLAGTPAWTELTPTGTPPSEREGQSAIYDAVRDRLVVFGGFDIHGFYLNDVWTLSLAGTPAWMELAPAAITPPTGRKRHSAIYDPVRDRMVVFGGEDVSGNLSDTWALSLADSPAWTQLTPTGAPPSARWEHSAIYDPVRDRMVVFGGSSINDVWTLSLAGTPA